MQRKAEDKTLVYDHARLCVNKDNTNEHILHGIAVLSKLFEKCITDNLADF